MYVGSGTEFKTKVTSGLSGISGVLGRLTQDY